MKARTCMGFFIAAMLTLACAAKAEADSLTTVSCDGFVLRYAGQVEKEVCATKDSSEGRVSSKVSQIEITDRTFYLVATYYQSGSLSYYPARSLRELVDMSKDFSSVTAWQTLPDTHGFAVAAFEAAQASDNKLLVCAIFASYSGTTTSHAEYTDGPGYKNMIAGYYCPQHGFASTQAGSESMTSLQDNIGRLQVSQEQE